MTSRRPSLLFLIPAGFAIILLALWIVLVTLALLVLAACGHNDKQYCEYRPGGTPDYACKWPFPPRD